jgi:hypothetical protein
MASEISRAFAALGFFRRGEAPLALDLTPID